VEKQKTGAELLAHLKETGTGRDRVERVEAFLKERPEATAADVFEWAHGDGMPHGTLDKMHRFFKGYAYDPVKPGELMSDKAVAALGKVASLEAEVRERDAQNALLLKENRRLREENDLLRKQQAPEKRRAEAKQLQPQ
jgi:hypothetical protein